MLDNTGLNIFNELKNKIQNFTKTEKSLLERYNINYTGMLIYSEEKIDIEFCKEHIRDSDDIVALEPNLVFIIYNFVDGQHSEKAAQNILYDYQKRHPQQNIYVVISSQDQKITVTELEGRLVQILDFAIHGKITNRIVTYYDID